MSQKYCLKNTHAEIYSIFDNRLVRFLIFKISCTFYQPELLLKINLIRKKEKFYAA